MATNEEKVKEKYPQAFAKKSRFWRVHRDPSEPFSGIYLGAAVTKQGAWDRAWKNIQRGPQCCFPHPLDYVVCDQSGNTLEIENTFNGKVLLNIIEHCPKGESRTSQMIITEDMSKIVEIRDALDRVIQAVNPTMLKNHGALAFINRKDLK